jgi:hypothetical protein
LKKYLTEKNRKIALLACSIICGFICVDTFLLPSKSEKEFVYDIKVQSNLTSKGGYKSYTLETSKKKRNISKKAYQIIKTEDSIDVYNSVISNSFQKIGVKTGNAEILVNTGFLYEIAGVCFLGIAILMIGLYFFLTMINYNFSKNSIVVSIILLTILLITQHFKN